MSAIPFPEPPLADEVIRLRPWALSDVDAAHRATQDPLIPQFTRVPANQTREDVRRFIADREAVRLSGERLPLVIGDVGSEALLGTIALMELDWEQHRADIGFWLAPWARGRGIATRAVTLLARWALEILGLARIQMGIYPSNQASQRVAERAGFVREGVLRSFLEVKGCRQDVVLFSLLPGDVAKSPSSARR
jgi:RimJ/RimL family protein N-acetyltransferase